MTSMQLIDRHGELWHSDKHTRSLGPPLEAVEHNAAHEESPAGYKHDGQYLHSQLVALAAIEHSPVRGVAIGLWIGLGHGCLGCKEAHLAQVQNESLELACQGRLSLKSLNTLAWKAAASVKRPQLSSHTFHSSLGSHAQTHTARTRCQASKVLLGSSNLELTHIMAHMPAAD